ncbi:MAG: hypothetical protein U9R57_14110 [Thermodesulfobacteriota bacterium]|nr:hypothetical protein [Thermodesulfobacteriota bacterium]
MNKTSTQLETVFQEVTDHFANIPRITITPGEGSPPDQYSVNYQITGVCKESDGEVYTCENHDISISLPFGFPHFPPNCLPESPTFHPDFDSSAICIGDVWEADKSIVKLILHIGRMISGEIYSESNAFNQDAAEWYLANRDQLPFDNTDFAQLAASSPSPVRAEKNELDTIDTLNDADFEQSFPTAQAPHLELDIDTDRLRIMAKHRRFHALSKELKIIDEQFDDRAELEKQVQTAMDEAMALFRVANELENKGEQQKALDKYQAVENLVSDYPLLHESKERVQQAFDLLGDWVSTEANDLDSEISRETDHPETDSSSPERREKRTFFEDKKTASRKLLFFALGGGSIALVATLIFSYFFLGSSLEKAGKRYDECQSQLDKNNFHEAEKKCTEALSLTAEVQMVKLLEKKKLAKKIQTLLDSTKLREGLAGRTLFEGKYVSKSTQKFLLAFKEARENGDSFFEKKLWDDAAGSYTKALDIGKNTNIIDAPVLAEIRERLPRCQLNQLMQAGTQSLATSDWNGATEHFSKALKLAKANPQVLPETITELELLSNQAKFNALRDMGHKAFSAKEWSAALSSYQSALVILEKLDVSDPDTISRLHENIAKTEIYLTIEKGKEAFAASQWDDVIVQYGKAILILEENSKLLSRINTKESRAKLSRIMLHVVIIQDKQDVAKYLKSKQYALALEKLNNIKRSITSSQFADQTDFQNILKEIGPQVKDVKKQLFLIKQTTYLTKNYKKLFLKHYPEATRSALKSPKVEYLKNIGSKLLFRMQCTEATGGRAIRLQMDYLYSPSSNTWRFYFEK